MPRPQEPSPCEAWYASKEPRGYCDCLKPSDGASERIDALLHAMQPNVTHPAHGQPNLAIGSYRRVHCKSSRCGGVAVLLRGGAFRGLRYGNGQVSEATLAAQQHCSMSVATQLVAPFEAQGNAVDIFLGTYERDSSLVRKLIAPYARHVVSVTTLAQPEITLGSSQIAAFVQLLRSLLAHAADFGRVYSAVVTARLDLHLKVPVAARFDARTLRGIRFLWFERRSVWRLVWRGPPAGTVEYQNAGNATRQQWQWITAKMTRWRDHYFRPSHDRDSWQQHEWLHVRVPDSVQVMAFAAVPCFLAALRFEMTRTWRSNQTFEVQRKRLQHTQHLLPEHLHAALSVPNASAEPTCEPKRANGTAACDLGMLWPQGAFDARPCRSNCKGRPLCKDRLATLLTRSYPPFWQSNPVASVSMLNPLYDILPRMEWVREAGICQREADFQYDAVSETLCCPSLDYCCPNDAASCTEAPASGLFDASRVSDQTLKTSVRDWFLSRGIRRVCPVSEWDGHFCNFALNAQSYNRIRRLWRN